MYQWYFWLCRNKHNIKLHISLNKSISLPIDEFKKCWSVDHDQIAPLNAPLGSVWPGSTIFLRLNWQNECMFYIFFIYAYLFIFLPLLGMSDHGMIIMSVFIVIVFLLSFLI